MASIKRVGVVLFLLQVQAALSASSSLKSQYGTSVSAKGTVGHAMLLKLHQQQLLRKEASNGDDLSDLQNFANNNQTDIDSLADLDKSLQGEDDKKSGDDSKDSAASTASTDLGDDLLDTKDSSKTGDSLLDGSKASSDAGAELLDTTKDATKDADGADDAVNETMTLAGLEQGAKDAQDTDLLKNLKADMVADNEAQGTPQKVPSIDDAEAELDNEGASFVSINADLAKLHNQVFGDSKDKKDTPSMNSSALEVDAAQKASDWLDKALGEQGTSITNTTEDHDHSWLDEEYAKLQKNQ